MPEFIYTLRGVRKAHGDKVILNDVTLSFLPGAKIGVVGLGYVGLPLACEFAKAEFPVTGFEVDAAKVRELQKGRSYIADVPSRDLIPLLRRKKLFATTDATFPSLQSWKSRRRWSISKKFLQHVTV